MLEKLTSIGIKSLANKGVLIFGISLITFLAFSPSLMNDFVRWDDHIYVTENELIKEISLNDIGKFGNTVSGNFHPLTMMSLALDYYFFGMNPFYFHLTNLIFHILNTILVFFLIMNISRKNVFISLFTALIFGIHPMHVESVTWISERKDVLYSFFFLSGILLYFRYLDSKKIKWLFLVTFLFILSTFSKSAAVVFPVVLLLIDYYFNSKISLKNIYDKIHLFAISIIIGLVALSTQGRSGALEISNYTFLEKIQFSFLSLVLYIKRFFIPEPLSNVHPYPLIENDFVYLLPFLFIVLIALIIFKYRKKYPWIFWGASFFVVTIALVLQLIQVGGSFMAERYTYIPYIGLGFILYTAAFKILNNHPKIKIIGYVIIVGHLSVCSAVTYKQTKIWENSLTLWSNFIEKYPLHSSEAYTNIAEYYFLQKDTLRALEAYKVGIDKNPNNFKVYSHRGKYYMDTKKFDLAMSDFEKALSINNSYRDALIGKGAVNFYLGNYDQALLFYNRVIETNPNNHEIYNLRGNTHLKLGLNDLALQDFDKALSLKNDFKEALENKMFMLSQSSDSIGLQLFTKLIEENVNNYHAYTNRGVIFYKRKDFNNALKDFNSALNLKNDFSEALKGRSAVYFDTKQYSLAVQDITDYIRLISDNTDMIERRAICYVMLNDYKNAVQDYSLLIEQNPSKSSYFRGRSLMYAKLGDRENALKDIIVAQKMGETINENILKALQ